MNTISLNLNMTKNNYEEVREKMADAGIVPRHLHLSWLGLVIGSKDTNPRWQTVAKQSYHGWFPYIIVEPEQFITVFSFILLNTNLPTHQYLEIITLTKKQVFTLSEDKEWVTWCEENYPQYFN